ncbi:MAG: hypothetical protein ABOK23_07360 [Candidatus Methanoperedens sp.]|nr:hypothetical protein [Candidatus Methanoperedens sp.]
MKQILNYNIHNLIKFQIIRDNKRDYVRDLNLPFAFFEVKEMDAPDIILNIGKFTPSNNDCYLLDHKYHIKENYLYCKDSGGRAKWEVEIFGFEDGSTTINYNGKVSGSEALFHDRVPQNFILQPFIEYKLCKKGHLFIHAAGVTNNNKGYILAGRPSAFKSTLTMDFVRKDGFKWLGDDRVIIQKDKILCFPISPITFDFKCKYLSTEEFNGIFDRINLIKYLHNKADYKKCDKSIANSARLDALFFISRTNKGTIKKNNISLNEAVGKLIENNRGEMILLHFYKYMLAYTFVFPMSGIAMHWDRLRINLEKFLKEVPIYEVEIPQNYNSSVFREVHALL